MPIRFVSVYKTPHHEKLLRQLLRERPSFMNISHRKFPTPGEHRRFIRSKPYKEWHFILRNGERIGSVYLSSLNEIGLFLFRKFCGKGYEKEAAAAFIKGRRKLRLLANVSPQNKAYERMFREMGFRLIQHSYCLESK